MRNGQIGSAVLVLVVALLVLRPWEAGERGAAGPATARGRVVRAIDGDTIEVAIAGEREDVRLIGVDTPETVKPGFPVQCFGPRASDFTHHILDGRTVSLAIGVERRDVYGRLLAYVHLGRRRFVNAILVRRGLARSLTIPPNDRFAPLFRRLELRAARAGRGLWGACAP
jgi:endonuclease YncB( thermonuclease family)